MFINQFYFFKYMYEGIQTILITLSLILEISRVMYAELDHNVYIIIYMISWKYHLLFVGSY